MRQEKESNQNDNKNQRTIEFIKQNLRKMSNEYI